MSSVPRPLADAIIGVFWCASAVKVAGYTWAAVQNNWSQLPGPNGQSSQVASGPLPGDPVINGALETGDKLVSMETGIPISILEGGQKAIANFLFKGGSRTKLGPGTGKGNRAPLFTNK